MERIDSLCARYISGPGDTEGIAKVEEMLNWAFATTDPPERLKLGYVNGELALGFESDFSRGEFLTFEGLEPPASADPA
jgi:hypothetical protein